MSTERKWPTGRFGMILAVLLLWTCPPLSAGAATITVERIGGVRFVMLSGEIVPGDERKFQQIAVADDAAIVLLDSRGGSLVPALEIGKAIRIRGYATYVPGDAICVSSCALIWVAGNRRYVSSTGRIGFHASYKQVGDQAVETGMGNALVGHYLTLLNLPERAVLFATKASPYTISWLDVTKPGDNGIEFEMFGKPPAREATLPETPSPTIETPTVQPSPPQSAVKPYSWTGPYWTVARNLEACELTSASGTAKYRSSDSVLNVTIRKGAADATLSVHGPKFAAFEPGKPYQIEVDFIRNDVMDRGWGLRTARGSELAGAGRGLAVDLRANDLRADLAANDKIAVFGPAGLLDFIDLAGVRGALAALDACEQAPGAAM